MKISNVFVSALVFTLVSCGNKNTLSSQPREYREPAPDLSAADTAVLQQIDRIYVIVDVNKKIYYAVGPNGEYCKTENQALYQALGGVGGRIDYRVKDLQKDPLKSMLKKELSCPASYGVKAEMTASANGNAIPSKTVKSEVGDPGLFPITPGVSSFGISAKCTGPVASASLKMTENNAPYARGQINLPSPYTYSGEVPALADAQRNKIIIVELNCISSVNNAVTTVKIQASIPKTQVSHVAVNGSIEDEDRNKLLIYTHNGTMNGSLSALTKEKVVLRVYCDQIAKPEVLNKNTGERKILDAWGNAKPYEIPANTMTQSGTLSLEFKCLLPYAGVVQVGNLNISYTAPPTTTTTVPVATASPTAPVATTPTTNDDTTGSPVADMRIRVSGDNGLLKDFQQSLPWQPGDTRPEDRYQPLDVQIPLHFSVKANISYKCYGAVEDVVVEAGRSVPGYRIRKEYPINFLEPNKTAAEVIFSSWAQDSYVSMAIGDPNLITARNPGIDAIQLTCRIKKGIKLPSNYKNNEPQEVLIGSVNIRRLQ